MDDLEAEPAVGEREDLVGRRRPVGVAARIGDDHDLELEPLGAVDRQQPDRVGALLLARPPRAAPAPSASWSRMKRDEALDVAAAQLLVGAREPHQLAQVRVAALAVPARRGRRGRSRARRDDLLAEPLEREARRRRDEPLVALLERADQPPSSSSSASGSERSMPVKSGRRPGVPADQHERVVRDADERRGEHRGERLVVVAVVQQPQVREQVDDLLLAEVAAARSRGRSAVPRARSSSSYHSASVPAAKRRTISPGVASPRVDELAHPPGDVARLGPAPVLAGVAVGRLVGDEQLDRDARRPGPGTRPTRRAAGSRRRTPRRRAWLTAASTSGRER